ncbi:MAG: cell division protein CrgA [Propionicimonas sp.]
MPESKVRKAAADKRKQADQAQVAEERAKKQVPGGRQWVAPTFIAVGLFGVLWLVVYYVTAATGIQLPLMTALGGWNVVIGMGAMAAAFGIATLWK